MKYRKKPVVIEAWPVREIVAMPEPEIVDLMTRLSQGEVTQALVIAKSQIVVATLEGDMKAEIDDWLICGVKGEFYPCKPDIFEATYEAVEGEQQ